MEPSLQGTPIRRDRRAVSVGASADLLKPPERGRTSFVAAPVLAYSLAVGGIMDEKRIERGVREILAGIGEGRLNAEVLANTPRRVAAMYAEFFEAIEEDPADALAVVYQEAYEEMIVMKDIPFFSICEHHLLPFIGKADVVYVPKEGRIVGASKLARVVDVAAGRPQLQERLTSQIADALVKRLDPHGVLVRIEASHLCMTLRGVKKPGATMVTSAIRGRFYKDEASRAEAFALIA
jgi:GTP cyclohydrolase I